MDQRKRRTWRHLIVGVWVARSTQLAALGRVVAPLWRGQSVKAAAMAQGNEQRPPRYALGCEQCADGRGDARREERRVVVGAQTPPTIEQEQTGLMHDR